MCVCGWVVGWVGGWGGLKIDYFERIKMGGSIDRVGTQSIHWSHRHVDQYTQVGQHHISATIQPSGACFTLHYTITPVNECTAPVGSSYRHRCVSCVFCLKKKV
jgi:hypothetical protein